MKQQPTTTVISGPTTRLLVQYRCMRSTFGDLAAVNATHHAAVLLSLFRDKHLGNKDIVCSYCVIFPHCCFSECVSSCQSRLSTLNLHFLFSYCLSSTFPFQTHSAYSRPHELLLESNSLIQNNRSSINNAHQHPTRFSAGLESQTHDTPFRCLPQQQQHQPSKCSPSCTSFLPQSCYSLDTPRPT